MKVSCKLTLIAICFISNFLAAQSITGELFLESSPEVDIVIVDHSPGINIYQHDFITGIHQNASEMINEFQLYISLTKKMVIVQ